MTQAEWWRRESAPSAAVRFDFIADEERETVILHGCA